VLDVVQRTDPPPFDAAVVGSAVYMGRWMKEAAEFVRSNRDALGRWPLWLFSSGPVGYQPLPEPKEITEFRDIASFRGHHTFLGALDKGKLSLAERLAVKAVKAPEGDFRDWEDIDAWASTIASELSAVTRGPSNARKDSRLRVAPSEEIDVLETVK
jgi:menaquinone-dependent protoporphyrinogen oxidase